MKNKFLITLSAAAFLLLILAGVYQVKILNRAHSTFDNYYAFRGCLKLISKTDDYGVCQTSSGQTIKIVKFDNRWFLDGDLPCGFLCF